MRSAVSVARNLCNLALTVLIGFVIFWLVDGTRGIDWGKVGVTALVLGGISGWLDGR